MRNRIDIQKLKELFDKGYSYKAIANELKVTKGAIGRAYRRNFGVLLDRGRAARQSLSISEEQEQILFGGLLGDIHISPHIQTFRGSIIHSIKQEEYAKYLHNKLGYLCGKFRYVKVKASGKIYDECSFTIRPNLNLSKLYSQFYKDFEGKKDVPIDLSLLTPLAIAIWFMDDGFLVNNGHSKTLGFSTCSFSIEGLQRLQKYLLDTYDIETIIRKNFYLIVRRKDSIKLVNLIRPYIIDSMLYKLDGLC